MSGPLPGRRLQRALTRDAARAGVPISIEHHREMSWESATFSGARHLVDVSAVSGEALGRWLRAIDAAAIEVPGHIVADLQVGGAASANGITRFRLTGVTVAAA